MQPEEELAHLREASLLRQLREVQAVEPGLVTIDGKNYVDFSSNDYLGLSLHEEVKAAFKQGIDQWGAGSGASRLISGSQGPHQQLESYLAETKGRQAARFFANGYATSLGVLSGLLGKDDVVLLDKLRHASLIDGAKLSGATLRVFPHNNMEKLRALLEKYSESICSGNRVVIVTESVFSMDGDTADLASIVALKKEFGALLLVDEAHGLGVRGEDVSGLGLGHELGVVEAIDFHMGTLGKAAGVAGGYVACDQVWADLIVNRSRSFIYSTAPPAAQAMAAQKGLELLHGETGNSLRQQLWDRITYFCERMEKATGIRLKAESAIVPWHVGEAEKAIELSESLKQKGLLVPAVRYPTVGRGAARLRITFSAVHTKEQIDALVAALQS